MNTSIGRAGHVLYGTLAVGLSADGNQLWTRVSPGVEGDKGTGFGESLATGDFDGDGRADLAIGSPQTTAGGISDAGEVNVLHGSETGITADGDQLWNQDS